jgi:hypothetical protein
MIRGTGAPLPYRDPQRIDAAVGTKRKAFQMGTAFWNWPIWQAYPTWHQFQKQISEERAAAIREGREPHISAQPPGISKQERLALEQYGDVNVTNKEATGQRTTKWRPMGKNLGPKHPVKNSIKAPKG